MSGARPAIADTPEAIAEALKERRKPVLIVGSEALKANRHLSEALHKVAKPNPWLRADAIVVQRDKNRVYMAGLTDDGHYAFDWDVNVAGELQPGENLIVVRNRIEHHVGGMFRRPFLYMPVAAKDEG